MRSSKFGKRSIDTEIYKIGRGQDSRELTVSKTAPYPYTVIKVWKGAGEFEKAIHRHLKQYNIVKEPNTKKVLILLLLLLL